VCVLLTRHNGGRPPRGGQRKFTVFLYDAHTAHHIIYYMPMRVIRLYLYIHTNTPPQLALRPPARGQSAVQKITRIIKNKCRRRGQQLSLDVRIYTYYMYIYYIYTGTAGGALLPRGVALARLIDLELFFFFTDKTPWELVRPVVF